MVADTNVSDWDYWINRPEVFPWQACALSLDLDPDRLKFLYHPDALQDTNGAKTLESLRRRENMLSMHLANDALPMSFEHSHVTQDIGIRLDEFAAWALSLPKPWDMPEQMRQIARAKSQAAPSSFTAPTAADPMPKPTEAVPTKSTNAAWTLRKPIRDDGLAGPIFRALKAAHEAGAPRPNARDVLEDFRIKQPTEIVRVLTDGCDYFDRRGGEASADLESIRKRIDWITALQAPAKTRKRRAVRATKTGRRA
jgi:hypothetical protein